MSNRCTAKDIKMQFAGHNAVERCDAVNKYLHAFDPPKYDDNDVMCHGCSERLSGILGTFIYDVVHGEGHCSKCGRECRANHYPKDDGGELLFDKGFVFILQYHVDEEESNV